MSKTSIPKNYHDLLGLYDTQRAIGIIKTIFQEKLCAALHLKRVTAPLFVLNGSGLNDDLNGVERPVSFDVPCLDERAEVVHSLAKWKRYALAEYGFRPGQGLVTDMNAIRRDEELDNLHSIYVDQWDWEKVITAKDRTLPFLQETVRDIVDAVCSTADELRWKFPELKAIRLTREPTFITTQELEDLYPDLTPKERENAFTRAHGTVCIMQIGGQLKSGVLIRHLVLPGELENTKDVIDWVAETFRPGEVLFSLMSQYTPQPGAAGPLARHVTRAEYRAAVRYMENCGIRDGFTQERTSAREEYTPAFDLRGI